MKIYKRLSVLLCLSMLMVLLTPAAHAGSCSVFAIEQPPQEDEFTQIQEQEPNNSHHEANVLRSGQKVSGEFSYRTDTDYYEVTPDKDGQIVIVLYSTSPRATINLLNIDRNLLKQQTESEPVGDNLYRFELRYFSKAGIFRCVEMFTQDISTSYTMFYFQAGFTDKFTDVPQGKYYQDPVNWADTVGVTTGVDATHFVPNATCTREQLICMLWRYHGCPEPSAVENPFTDVAPDAYYYDAICWAIKNKITSGVSDDLFGVGRTCTRAQLATFLWRSGNGGTYLPGDNCYSDVSVDDYYFDAVTWCNDFDIMKGVAENTFSPDAMCTRAQVVTALYRNGLNILDWSPKS